MERANDVGGTTLAFAANGTISLRRDYVVLGVDVDTPSRTAARLNALSPLCGIPATVCTNAGRAAGIDLVTCVRLVAGAVTLTAFGSAGGATTITGGIDFNVPVDNRYFQIAWYGNRTDAQPFEFEVTGVAITNIGSHSVRLYNEGVCDVIFSVAGNRLTGTGGRSVVQMTRNEFNAAGEPVARLFCKVPQVFDYDATLLLGYATKPTNGKPYCGFIDLCGGDQGFAAAFGHSAEYQSYEVGGKPQGAYSVVTSSGGPALLCSRHTDDASTWSAQSGAAHTSAHFTGTGRIRFGSQMIIIFR